MTLGGHLWTIAPNLRHRLRPLKAPPAAPWTTTLRDPAVGVIRLHGRLQRPPADAPQDLVVLVHGLGGSVDSQYMIRAAQAAARCGLGALRLGLRGADRSGADFSHAGLTADLEATLACPSLAWARRIYLLGFSLGGHTCLRFGLAPSDPRVRAIAALCAPLDLRASAAAIDHPRAVTYRRYLLRGLLEIYAAVAANRPVPTPLAVAQRIATIREWDTKTVVPRFGFTSADHYYSAMSAGPRLSDLALPALIVAATADPMVPAATLHQPLGAPPPQVTVRWLDRGGHVGFPRASARELAGLSPHPATGDLYDRLLAWLRQR